MARYTGNAAGIGGSGGQEDYDDEDDDSISQGHDRIRRNYIHHAHQAHHTNNQDHSNGIGNSASQQDTTIHVTLNESYFSSERRALVNLLANIRQKFNSMQMFNPAKNQSIKEQQQQWNEDVSELNSTSSW